MLFMSKQSSAPSSDASRNRFTRASRSVRSRSKFPRSSQSPPLTPEAFAARPPGGGRLGGPLPPPPPYLYPPARISRALPSHRPPARRFGSPSPRRARDLRG